ncbi:MAG: hypothetical protein HW387_588 [Parachlamydiales bacterium]|nr:hypothetical protein [Parachlamydiales bacterium]
MAAPHRSLLSEARNLIRDALDHLQSEKTILAEAHDCDYFRRLYRTLKDSPPSPAPIAPKPIPLEIKTEPAVLIAPPPIPTAPPPAKNPEAEPVRTLAPKDTSFEDVRKMMSRVFPEMTFPTIIPSDVKARQIAERWITKNQSAPLSILFFQEQKAQHQFLVNLTAALDTFYGEAKLIQAEGIEKDNQWEAFLSVPQLKLVIVGDYALWQMPHLLQYYRENPTRTEKFLQKTPVMLLPDLTLYLKDPSLKRSLWKALCQKIGSL